MSIIVVPSSQQIFKKLHAKRPGTFAEVCRPALAAAAAEPVGDRRLRPERSREGHAHRGPACEAPRQVPEPCSHLKNAWIIDRKMHGSQLSQITYLDHIPKVL